MHTPGPWTIRHDFRCANGTRTIGVAAASIRPGAGAVAWPCGVTEAQEIANAHLIAAAPELLQCVEKLLVVIQDRELNDETIRAVNAAEGLIARVRGDA